MERLVETVGKIEGKEETGLHTLEPNTTSNRSCQVSLLWSILDAKTKGHDSTASMANSVAYGHPKVARHANEN